ncbi:MAG: TonB-dependent receptor [Paludibacteraceae bacterium]
MKKTTILSVCCLGAALAVSSVRAYAADDTLTVVMNQMQDVQVVGQRVQQTTINHDVVGNERLNRDNTGQNLPYLLSTVPALQVTSDDGLGVGYTYFRVRGTDHTRINMTVNDVPLNDQESQTVFWVNMTDMAASMSSIDVQRGVGTSTNGSASFGASLNMRTGDQDTVNHFTIGFNGGMYNTFREMLSGHLVLPGNWRVNARFSKVNSDGFLYRTGSDLYSYYGDLGWYGKQTQVVARFFGGKEKTGMGWDGVDYNTAYGIDGADRRYNPAGEYKVPALDENGNPVYVDGKLQKEKRYYSNQTDNYAQQHAQLQVTHRFTPHWSLNATLHYTHGGGYYEQYKKKKFSYWGFEDVRDEDGEKIESYGMYRKLLDNHFAGAILSAKYVNEHVDVQFGAAANDYIGTHFGTLHYMQDTVYYGPQLPIDYEYYRNNANKVDANAYGKVNWRVINRAQEQLSLYADLQYRYVRYHRDGINDEDMVDLPLTVNNHFFNPKAGLTYQNHGHLLYGSFGMANREPSRDNYKENVIYNPTTNEYTGLPKAETLYDYELGYQYAHPRVVVGANLYFMDYDNQLVLTGEYNDVGAMKTTNVKDSYRMGAELTIGVKITDWFRWDGNFVLSRNKILHYKQYIDRYDNQDDWTWVGQDSVVGTTTIAFSPMITAMSLFTFDIAGFVGTIQTNVVSRQYLDNTEDANAMLKAYTTTDLNLQYTLPLQRYKHCPDIKLLCRINNIFNAKYASNGGADASRFEDNSRCVWYYAQAGINVHAGFVINW